MAAAARLLIRLSIKHLRCVEVYASESITKKQKKLFGNFGRIKNRFTASQIRFFGDDLDLVESLRVVGFFCSFLSKSVLNASLISVISLKCFIAECVNP